MTRIPVVIRWRLALVFIMLVVTMAPAAFAQPLQQVSVNGNVSGPAAHPQHTLVRFRPGAAPAFLPGSGGVTGFSALPGLFLANNPPGIAVAEAVRRYRANPNVLYAEPDYVVQAILNPTDPLWAQQYDMPRIAAPTAWDSQTSAANVVVVVIDTGIDFTHPDLQGNLWTNPADGAHGFTCMNGVCSPGGVDDYGHGTHVAGTIGAVGNNGIGIAGINWQVQLLSIKFLNSGGSGLISDAVLSFNKVLALQQQGINIRVTSNSWGGGGFTQSLKDAMAQVEADGAVNVCAAGNNGQNADANPMYPAAYDNRGIISVLASDQNDVGAGFTNYGLASVDIAAPGVSTVSTVPAYTCSLCDPSGYKALSGTSMATPHVSGVLAAMFQKNPALTVDQARDAVLFPTNYDSVTDPRAGATSTGGRLNFAKSLANALTPPPPNNFPVISMGPNVFASAGSQVNLTATATDQDNDPLRMGWQKSTSAGSLWLLGFKLNSLFPDASGNSVSFTAPSVAQTALAAYDASVADGRGGGAHGRDYVTVSPDPNHGQPPSGVLTVSPTDAPAGTTFTINFPNSDPEGGTVAWDSWTAGQNGASGTCCFTGSSRTVTLNTAGVYRFSTQAIDAELNLSTRQSAVVHVGGATGEPPIVNAVLDKTSGVTPITVNIDMSGSTDSDGTVVSYSISCGGGVGAGGGSNSHGSCTYNTPGAYWLLLQVFDNNSNSDIMSAYVVATPTPVNDTNPPTVALTSPAPGDVTGVITVAANASDAETGIQKVDFYRDSPGVLIGTATAAPYSISWNTGTVSPGPHTLYAVATDGAGNTATSASVAINVTASPTPPSVSISSPSNGGTVARKSTVPITTSVTPGSSPISHVDFFVNSTLVCSVTTSLYTCNWTVPAAANKTYNLQAKAFDDSGREGDSAVVTVTAR